MKSCVVTANYACDPNKVWLYLTKPTLNNWRKDVSGYEESDDGMKATEKNTDGGETQIVFTRKDKPRCLSCSFQKGKISGTFTARLSRSTTRTAACSSAFPPKWRSSSARRITSLPSRVTQ